MEMQARVALLGYVWAAFRGKKVIITPFGLKLDPNTDRLAAFWSSIALAHRIRLKLLETAVGGAVPLYGFLAAFLSGLFYQRLPWLVVISGAAFAVQYLIWRGFGLGELGSEQEHEQLHHIVETVPLQRFSVSRDYYDQLWDRAYIEGMP